MSTPPNGQASPFPRVTFPRPAVPPKPSKVRCRDCGTKAQPHLMVNGLGSSCARDAGLIGPRRDTGQDGPDLLDLLKEDPEDHCDGHDR